MVLLCLNTGPRYLPPWNNSPEMTYVYVGSAVATVLIGVVIVLLVLKKKKENTVAIPENDGNSS